jgi:putative YhbY family RNA-binding protein
MRFLGGSRLQSGLRREIQLQKDLTSTERQLLKGRAHRLAPVVLVGAEGLTPGVLAEIDRALNAHELIKIRVMSLERGSRETLLDAVCSATNAARVQHIGKVLVVYRQRPPEAPPAPRPGPARAPAVRRRARPPGPPRRAKIRSR